MNVKIFSIFSKDYSDSQLIEMIVKGKNSREMAWEFIYKKWRAYYLKPVMNKGGFAEEVDEIFSEVAIAFENRILKSNQTDIQNLKVYFSQSIYYAWLKYRKLNSKINSIDEFPEIPIEFSDNLRSVELTSMLDEILNELSEKCKEILKLFAEGFSMKLIAEKFNFSSDSKAKKEKYECQTKLKKYVENNQHVKKMLKEIWYD
ncbi:MAG: sigma-70 family RNA polymerase sigma factor [Saprospiraceae bacterium]|nr:sigma-70 family RNA polymerase sigma factor [Saprospiraceae bacterium]